MTLINNLEYSTHSLTVPGGHWSRQARRQSARPGVISMQDASIRWLPPQGWHRRTSPILLLAPPLIS